MENPGDPMDRAYHNTKEAQKEYLIQKIPHDVAIMIILVALYFHATDALSWLLFSLVCIAYFFGRDIYTSFYIIIYPFCTLTDYLFTYEYGREALPWTALKSVTVHSQTKVITFMKRDASDKRTSVTLKWIEHESTLYQDLKKQCKRHSMSFTMT